MRKLSRREFVHLTAAALGGVAASGCSGGTTEPSGTGGPPEPPPPPPPPWNPPGPNDPIIPVSAVQGTDLAGMTEDALNRLGGIGTVVQQDETVFIKPNMVTLPWGDSLPVFTNGECTKVEIVVAAAEECLKAGAAEVLIGDGSQMPTLNWRWARTLDGSTTLADEVARLTNHYGKPVNVVSLEVDSPNWTDVPSAVPEGIITVYSMVAQADHVISIPVAKTHANAHLTLAFKNFVGVTPLGRYAQWTGDSYNRGSGLNHNTPASIAQCYLDAAAGINADLAVVDFSIGIEGQGPTTGYGGRTVDMRQRGGSWLVLASRDLAAADATAARIMSHDPATVTQLRMAFEMGLGEVREEAIEILGPDLADLTVNWARALVMAPPAGAPAYARSCPLGCR